MAVNINGQTIQYHPKFNIAFSVFAGCDEWNTYIEQEDFSVQPGGFVSVVGSIKKSAGKNKWYKVALVVWSGQLLGYSYDKVITYVI